MTLLPVLSIVSREAYAAKPTPEDREAVKEWIADHIDAALPQLPFSFSYDGRSSREFLRRADQTPVTWDLKRESHELDEKRSQRVMTYTEPRSGLDVRLEATIYNDYPAVEWIVYFQNNGDEDTEIIEDIRALDISLKRPGPGAPKYVTKWTEWKGEFDEVAVREDPGEFVVHHATGGIYSFWAFQPHDDVLGPNKSLTFGGVSSMPELPFFNVEWPNQGIIAGLGWTAPWRADFVRDDDRSLDVTVSQMIGQQPKWFAPHRKEGEGGVHFLLHPGERVRTPRVLLMFWCDDRIRGHNVWRQLLLDHYSPRHHGELLTVPTGVGSEWHDEKQATDLINFLGDNKFPVDYFWMDLGWARRPKSEDEEREHLADDIANDEMFPNGLEAVAEAAHKRDIKYLLWFGGSASTRFQYIYPYPERVRKHRPELLSDEYPGVDSGNPMINQWMIQHYGDRIAELGIDIFRWDTHSAPPPDTSEDRQGINWARTVEGLYEFWDALLERFPDLIIDCCGGGAVNMDLESMQRCVYLWRCDWQCGGIHEPENVFNPSGIQGQTYGVSFWAPLTSGAFRELTPYAFRSALSPGVQISAIDAFHQPFEKYFDPELAHSLFDEFYAVRDCFYGDYYPLTGYNMAEDTWMAWQFDRPDLGLGVVQAFRRGESDILTCRHKLHGLDPAATYELTSMDLPEALRMTGSELMESGLEVTIEEQPGAIVIRYTRDA